MLSTIIIKEKLLDLMAEVLYRITVFSILTFYSVASLFAPKWAMSGAKEALENWRRIDG